MDLSVLFYTDGDGNRQILWGDSDRVVCRGQWIRADDTSCAVLAVLPAAEHPAPASLARLAREFELKDELDEAWAVRPVALGRERGRPVLLLADPGGELLEPLLGAPMPIEQFLRHAIGLAGAIAGLHGRGLIHKDIKPAHCLVDASSGTVRLTGFGIASRLPRERQAPEPPEFIAGTLAYMAPEQTGRMNRSIDVRSDLYSLGVTLYQMLVGRLPFTAQDPMEWVHCHIARKPVAPAERLQNIPAPVSAIIMKLLAKTAEERYQTATGLEHDLRRCLAAWDRHGRLDEFPLGRADTPDRLWIAEKLYGRSREVESLLATFDRVVRTGTPELVLVSGYAGVGKSSVVNELHRALVPRGFFAAGKFDQYKRDIPYSTVAQAFQDLIRSLLARSNSELNDWRDALREALGPNGQLIVDLVPELKLIIGDQAPVPELPPQSAQRRFQLVLRRFIGVFARPDHPLVLFLDDLQWLDAATLDLLEDLLTPSERQHLLLIGAYRDNEVTATHPLLRTLDAIRRAEARVQEIRLTPFACDQVGQLIADALRCEPAHSAGLAALLHEKTGGNPFFLIQFLYALSEEGLLWFEHDKACWCWDVEGIHAKAYTENVVDLMVGKIGRLPDPVQRALQALACLGNTAEVATLSLVRGTTEERVDADLWEAVRLELIQRSNGAYRFIHDRIQEAAYLLVPQELRGEVHLRIGRLLAAHTPPDKREEAIFDIVSQLNRGAALMATRDEREQLAEFNLAAGKRAKHSAAYASALNYCIVGAALLEDDRWERRHDLAWALELHRAECEFLTGALTAAQDRLAALSARASTTLEHATVACLSVDLYTTLDQSRGAVAVGLASLRHLGIDWSPHPTEDEAQREYEQIRSWVRSHAIEGLVDGPLMADPESLAIVDVLTKLAMPAVLTDVNLYVLVISRVVNLSLARGHSDGSCFAYESLLAVAGGRFGDYDIGFRFARAGYELVEQRGLMRFPARIYVNFGNLLSWTQHIRDGRDVLHRAFDTANTMGDLTYVAYASYSLTTNLLAAGDPLDEVQRAADQSLALARQMRFGLVADIAATQLALVRTLRGLTPHFGSFDDADFDERRVEQRFHGNPDLARAECWYWIRLAQARYFAGHFAAAVDATARAGRLLWTTLSNLEVAEYCFYAALSHAASADSATAEARAHHVEALAGHHRQLQIWAGHCPSNFDNRAALVGAEIARLEGRELEAERLYEKAIRAARANGFVHNEALAYEVAARFHAARGFDEIARLYLRNARYCYLRWGADGKVRQLDRSYPQLADSESAPGPTHTIDAPIEHLDLATVLRVSQAVSGEIVLESLLDTLMRTAIEQAGAERGVLVLPEDTGQRIAAEATTSGDDIVVHLRDQPVTATALPEAIVQTVLRTRQTMILEDAAADPAYAAIPYVRLRQSRSVLCLPLVNQSRLIGVLYLENDLAPRVFTPTRIAVLRLVASQAANALENTRLYRDLAEREAKIRRLVDANIIGIFVWESEGPIIEANDAFLRIVGYDRDDLLAGRIRWTDLTPAEWMEHHEQRWTPEIRLTGSVRPYEKEYFRKDGSRVPILVGATSLDDSGRRGVSFVLDLTERKRAEQALHQAQAELAHVTRVMTMGELTASIAHEINQPLAALATNASASLRWLARQPPDLEEARSALHHMIRDSQLAADIVTRVHSLVKKSPPVKTRLDLGAAIQEVLSLVESEARRHTVLIRTELPARLPPVRGDRVQLQQVILNLAMNGIQAMKDVVGRPRELWIRAHAHGRDTVLVSVQDTGIGLAAKDLTRVFEAFYTTKAEGMGMGLSISRSIIEAHGGQLWSSANEDHGVTFRFTVPTDEANDGHAAD